MAGKDEPSLELPSLRRGAPTGTGASVEESERRSARPASLPATVAAGLAGLVVGAATLALVRVGQRGCEAVSGTASCGAGPGLLVLVVVVAALTLLGATLLRWLGSGHAGSTSALAVTLALVVTLLLLTDVLSEASGAVFVALTVAAAYVVAHLVTTAAPDG